MSSTLTHLNTATSSKNEFRQPYDIAVFTAALKEKPSRILICGSFYMYKELAGLLKK